MKSIFLAITFLGLSAFAKPPVEKRKPTNTPDTVVVSACDSNTPRDIEFFSETKSFSKGNIRAFVVDTYGEPVCCSSHLLIFMPMKNEPMASKCFHVKSNADGLGFAGVNMKNITSSYSPTEGLTLTVPFSYYQETGTSIARPANLLINQATETVTVK